MKILLAVLPLIGIRTHRSFRLAIRGTALLVGLLAGFCVGIHMELQEFWKGFGIFLIVIATAIVELSLIHI